MSDTVSSSVTKQYDWSEVSPSVAVVETIAEVDEREIDELPVLAHALNPDALDDLLTDSSTTDPEGVVVSLQFHGYDVSVSTSGRLIVKE